MDYAGYFLIVRDFIHHAREEGIAVGPGRGSAAGSLVAYCLGITDIDPIRFGLLFERFLNPERMSMPDIDVDFDYRRRAEVIDYVKSKYGEESVTQIITFGTMAARGVIRDVGRALGIAFEEIDRIAKLVPGELGITLDRALEQIPELAEMARSDEAHARLIRVARILEGLARHASTHAAGVLIAPGRLDEMVPLFKSGKGEVSTQWDMKSVEKVGLLKMDFLGLRTLTVIEDALDHIRERTGVRPDLRALPLDDPATYDLLRRAGTVAVFQLESSGMRDLLRRLAPESFDDIVAVNALYRPGPHGLGDGAELHRPQARARADRVHARNPGADPHAHLRHDGLPGAGDADRERDGRLHPRRGRPPAPRHGQEGQGGDGGAGEEVRGGCGGPRHPSRDRAKGLRDRWPSSPATVSTRATAPPTRSSPTRPRGSRRIIPPSSWPPPSPAKWKPPTGWWCWWRSAAVSASTSFPPT